MDIHDHQEMIAAPEHGRVFERTTRAGLADCAPSGRARLDAFARWLQDIAYADIEDAGLADAAVWVVRRTRLRVQRFPRFSEHLRVRTFCSGIGRMWAERRTTIAPVGASAIDVDAVSLWVHLDPISGRPAPLTDAEIALYGGDRRVKARLRHPAVEEPASQFAWTFRATDCDLADHVNNAAYWQLLEEELIAGPEPEQIDAEIEFRTPSQPGEKRILASGPWRWIVSDGDEVHASAWVSGLRPHGASSRAR
jgi:acyl-ACP thioesterase